MSDPELLELTHYVALGRTRHDAFTAMTAWANTRSRDRLMHGTAQARWRILSCSRIHRDASGAVAHFGRLTVFSHN